MSAEKRHIGCGLAHCAESCRSALATQKPLELKSAAQFPQTNESRNLSPNIEPPPDDCGSHHHRRRDRMHFRGNHPAMNFLQRILPKAKPPVWLMQRLHLIGNGHVPPRGEWRDAGRIRAWTRKDAINRATLAIGAGTFRVIGLAVLGGWHDEPEGECETVCPKCGSTDINCSSSADQPETSDLVFCKNCHHEWKNKY